MTTNYDTDTIRHVQNSLYEETAANGRQLSEAGLQTGQGESDEGGPTYDIIQLASAVNKQASNETRNSQLDVKETELGR